MCTGFEIAAAVTVASSVIGGGAKVAGAQGAADAATQSANIHNEQLAKDIQNAKNQGQQAMNERNMAYLETRAANIAYIAASGGQNISFQQAIDPANRKALARDFSAIAGQVKGNTEAAKTQIRVNRINAKNAQSSVKYAAIGAGADIAGSIAGAASDMYKLDKTYGVT